MFSIHLLPEYKPALNYHCPKTKYPICGALGYGFVSFAIASQFMLDSEGF